MAILKKCLTALIAVFLFQESCFLSAGSSNPRTSGSRSNSAAQSGSTRTAAKPDRAPEKTTVVLEGTIDGKGTFTFRQDKITYQHAQFDYPTDITINGTPWNDLDEPFELGFEPVFSTADVLEKKGRNTIRTTPFQDRFELYIYDSDSSFSHYRVSIVFEKKPSGGKDPEAEIQDEKEDDEFFIYLPGDKDRKKETAPANTKKEPGEHEKLQGVLYFLVRRTGGRSAVISTSGKKDTGGDNVFSVLQRFVLGSWMSSTNSKGERYYPDLERDFRRKAVPSFSCFYQSNIAWGKGAELFGCKDHFPSADIDPDSVIGRLETGTDQSGVGEKNAGWVAVYSGYVVAPFSGKFRFLGFCDDMMVVRFNRQIVLDYGLRSLTTGLPMESGSGNELRVILGGNSSMKEEKRLINESPLYSRNKLEISFPEYDGHGLARSPVLSIQKGQVIPISILLGEQCRDKFGMILLVERLDSNGKSFADPSKYIYLFRTTTELPDSPRSDSFPDFNPNSPVWKVVDSKGKPIPPRASAKTQDKTKQ